METLEELKAIIAGIPDNLASYVDEDGDYLTNNDGEFQIWNSDSASWDFVEVYALPIRSLSDIKRIIELMEIVEDTAALGFLTPSFDSGVSHKQLCKKYEALKWKLGAK